MKKNNSLNNKPFNKRFGYFFGSRCYFVYCLVVGYATHEEVAKSMKPKLIITAIISVIYDVPRVYLNVNLYGALCSFYYNVVESDNNIISLRHNDGKFPNRVGKHRSSIRTLTIRITDFTTFPWSNYLLTRPTPISRVQDKNN